MNKPRNPMPPDLDAQLTQLIAEKCSRRIVEMGPGVTAAGIEHIVKAEAEFAAALGNIIITFIKEDMKSVTDKS